MCLPHFSLRNVFCMRVHLRWGLLASGYSHDGELPLCFLVLPPQSDSLGRKGDQGRGGGKGGNTSRAQTQRSDLSQGLKWDQSVGKLPLTAGYLHLLPVLTFRSRNTEK